MFSYEYIFHVSAAVNKHNVQSCGTRNSHKTRYMSRTNKRKVLRALFIKENVEIYYFDDTNVDGERYLHRLSQ